MFKHDPNLWLQALAFIHHVVSGDPGFARRGPQLAGDHSDGGSLARAIGTQEAKDLAWFHVETNVVYGAQAVVGTGQVLNLLRKLSIRAKLFWILMQ